MPIFSELLYFIASATIVLLALVSAIHALLRKRDYRSQILWTLTCLMLPLLGAAFYWFLGVNRIQTRARKWKEKGYFAKGDSFRSHIVSTAKLEHEHPEIAQNMLQLLQISRKVTGQSLTADNQVDLLFNGEEAFPAMISAIDHAQEYIFLCSYIFEGDALGKQFSHALIKAGQRGVDVRILIDAIGSKAGKDIRKLLRNQKNIRIERFLPPSLSWRILRINLRNHRKLLIVDGNIGFTGGMNISAKHLVQSAKPKKATQDLHFKFQGPIVTSFQEVFSEDWSFRVGSDTWPTPLPYTLPTQSKALCRGIKDGPNEDFEKLQWILIGAIGSARKHVRILTPYFIPSRELITAMRMAVLRGTQVEIILPQKSNIFFVDWASSAYLPELLEYGVTIYFQPAPFNHSKLLLVDDFYVLLGSANLDPRSLQLNFEFNVEVYDPKLAENLGNHYQKIKEASSLVQIETLRARPFLIRLRNAITKLLSPYL